MRRAAAAVLLVVLLTGGCVGDAQPGPSPTVTVTVTAAPRPGPTKTVLEERTVTAPPPAAKDLDGIGPGVWVVGEDVKPGTYRAEGQPDEDGDASCYWALLSATGGDDNIIDNQRVDGEGQSIVEITKKAKYFETDGCTPWVRRK